MQDGRRNVIAPRQSQISDSQRIMGNPETICQRPLAGSTLELHEEVFMDKPRHPQVIRPWKTGPVKKDMQRVPPTTEPRRERSKEVPSFKRR